MSKYIIRDNKLYKIKNQEPQVLATYSKGPNWAKAVKFGENKFAAVFSDPKQDKDASSLAEVDQIIRSKGYKRNIK